MLPHKTLLLTLLAVLSAPAASADAEWPGASACTNLDPPCEDVLCAHVWSYAHNVDERACLPDDACDGPCITVNCEMDPCLPEAHVCSERFRPPFHCDALLCASVAWGDVVAPAPACVRDPCDRLPCECQVGRCTPVCSEFMLDWNHCAGNLVCVATNALPMLPVCVPNPCTPGVAGCVPLVECRQDAGPSYVEASCAGLSPGRWSCPTCPPKPHVSCVQDTHGRVACTTTADPLA